MFGRHLELRLVKNTKPSETTAPAEEKPSFDVPTFVKDLGKQILIGTVVIISTTIVLETVGIIVINALDTAKE